HCVRADPGGAWAETREEEIDYSIAVGTDCCTLTKTVLSVGSCLGDLFGCPSIPTVAGHRDHDRCGGAVLATKGRVRDVHIAKKWTRRGIVCPDLLLVSEEGRVLLGSKDWLQPCVLISGCCRGYVVRARDVNCSNAFKRVAKVKCDAGIVEPR